MAKLSQVFDMKFADGVNVLDPPGSRGPPPCFPQRGGSYHEKTSGSSNTFYNNSGEKKAINRFMDAGINEYDMGIRINPPRQAPRPHDMHNGSVEDELNDALGNNYTRLAACNELSCGVNNWNGQFEVYPNPKEEHMSPLKKIRWNYKNDIPIRPSNSTTDPNLFYPRYGQPNVYQLQQDMVDQDEMVSMGPIAIKKNWLTWILIFILLFFVFDKMLLSTLMLRNSFNKTS